MATDRLMWSRFGNEFIIRSEVPSILLEETLLYPSLLAISPVLTPQQIIFAIGARNDLLAHYLRTLACAPSFRVCSLKVSMIDNHCDVQPKDHEPSAIASIAPHCFHNVLPVQSQFRS